MGPAAAAGQKAAEAAKSKLGEDVWNKAKQIWDKLRPEVEKKPEAAGALKEVAENAEDELAKAALPRDLKKLLEGMPPETVDQLRSIVSEVKSETRITTADRGGVAVGGNVSGGTITAGYHSYEKKPET